MKVRYLAVILGGLSLASPAVGEDSAGAGIGTSTCAQFAQECAKSPSFVESLYFAWAQGYMSGLNIFRSDNRYASLHAKSVEVEEDELRSYCDAHPLKNYVDAVMALYWSLPQNPLPSPK
jgi:hypothetical protein